MDSPQLSATCVIYETCTLFPVPVCNEPITETQDGTWNGTEHRIKWGMVQLNLNMEHVHACNGSPEQTQGAHIFFTEIRCVPILHQLSILGMEVLN